MQPNAFRPLSLLVGLAFFMEQLDATIIAPAIPEIAADFGVAPLSLNLTMTIYLLCSVAFIPASGHLAARWGTRAVFRGALLLFVASSVLCALSPNLVSLAAARALQGVGAALMVPVGRMAIVHATPRGELVLALAWMITPAMLGPLMGPPLGGLLTTWLSWHWIFLINVPIGLAGWWFAGRCMPQIHQAVSGRFDGGAWMLLAGILAAVIAALEWARHGSFTLAMASLAAVWVAVDQALENWSRGAAVKSDFSVFSSYNVPLMQPYILDSSTAGTSGPAPILGTDFESYFSAKWKAEFGVS